MGTLRRSESQFFWCLMLEPLTRRMVSRWNDGSQSMLWFETQKLYVCIFMTGHDLLSVGKPMVHGLRSFNTIVRKLGLSHFINKFQHKINTYIMYKDVFQHITCQFIILGVWIMQISTSKTEKKKTLTQNINQTYQTNYSNKK